MHKQSVYIEKAKNNKKKKHTKMASSFYTHFDTRGFEKMYIYTSINNSNSAKTEPK